jgi:hypothetical protein
VTHDSIETWIVQHSFEQRYLGIYILYIQLVLKRYGSVLGDTSYAIMYSLIICYVFNLELARYRYVWWEMNSQKHVCLLD